MLADFKKFILRDNVVNLAIGFTVGATFTTVVRSLVDDIIMPPIGLILGGTNFSNLMIIIKQGSPPGPYNNPVAAADAGAVAIRYGNFLNSLLTLLIIALAMFLIIRFSSRVNKAIETELGFQLLSTPKKKKPKCPFCFSEINTKATRCPHCTSKL